MENIDDDDDDDEENEENDENVKEDRMMESGILLC